MTRRLAVLIALLAVAVAGCVSGPGTPTTTPANETSISAEQVPGVTNGSVTNATALTVANDAAIIDRGGAVTISDAGDTYRLAVGADFSTFEFSGSRVGSDGQTVTIDRWSNETTQFIRMAQAGESSYRARQRQDDPRFFRRVGDYLAAGDFTVANESTGNGTVVFTADEYVPPADGYGPFENVTSFTGRLVVDESGLVHNLTITAMSDGEPHRFRYALDRVGIDRVARPDWIGDVPATASLAPDLSIGIENDSYLAIRNEGGDSVPRNSSLTLTTNGTTGTATFETALDAGETRYAYVDASGTVRLSADRPAASNIWPATSPVSVEITTADGVTLQNAGIGWSSSTASATETEVSGGSSGSSGGGSTSTTEVATPPDS